MHVDILLCAVFVACLCVTLLPHSNVPRGVQAHVSHIDESLVSETVYTVCLSAEGVRQAGVGEGKLRVGVIGCWLLLAGFVVPRFPKPNLRSRSMITFLPQLMIRRDKTWHFALRCRPASFARSLHYAMAHDGGTPGFAHGASETTMEVLRRLRRQEGFSKMQAVGGAAPGLFIGPQIASRDVSALAQHGITHILGLNGRSPMISTLVKVILRGGHAGGLCGSASHGTAGVKQGLTVKVVHMEDSPGVLRARALLACLHCVSQLVLCLACALADEDIGSCFQECFEFIHAALLARHSVLVYCTAGISRSATVVVGYLMWRHKMPYDKAFAEVKSARKYGLVDHLRCT